MFLPIARRLVTQPSGEPITLATVKNALRVEHTEDDTLIESIWIPSSRIVAEKLTGEKFITQTWDFTYPRFPTFGNPFSLFSIGLNSAKTDSFQLQIKPVQSVSIQYRDASGALKTFGTFSGSPLVCEEYSIIFDDEDPRIILNFNQQWPQTAPVENAVVVTVVAGYGEAVDVPSLYKTCMIALCGHFMENRQSVVVDESRVQAIEIPLGIRDLLTVPKAG